MYTHTYIYIYMCVCEIATPIYRCITTCTWSLWFFRRPLQDSSGWSPAAFQCQKTSSLGSHGNTAGCIKYWVKRMHTTESSSKMPSRVVSWRLTPSDYRDRSTINPSWLSYKPTYVSGRPSPCDLWAIMSGRPQCQTRLNPWTDIGEYSSRPQILIDLPWRIGSGKPMVSQGKWPICDVCVYI